MKKLFSLFLLICVIKLIASDVNTVDCRFSGFERAVELYKICSIKDSAINTDGVSISSNIDNTVGKVDVSNNKKIKFLPASPAARFPKLHTYEASSCAIKAISKSNFANLKSLSFLYLGFNEITTIKSDTFADLSSLIELVLSKINLSNLTFFFRLINLHINCLSNLLQEITKFKTLMGTR